MRMKFWFAIIVVGLAFGIAPPAFSQARDDWKGPGYYVRESYALILGPYPTADACNAALAGAMSEQEKEENSATCEYYPTDPELDLQHRERCQSPGPAGPSALDAEVLYVLARDESRVLGSV